MSQKSKIKMHLKVYGDITPLDALNRYGCFRLSDVIFKLRKEMDIKTTINEGKSKYAIYSI